MKKGQKRPASFVDDIIRLNEEGKRNFEIVEILGCSKGTVSSALKRYKVEKVVGVDPYATDIPNHKVCHKCMEPKTFDNFTKKDTPDGLRHKCRDCENEESRAWYKTPQGLKYNNDYYHENSEQIQARRKTLQTLKTLLADLNIPNARRDFLIKDNVRWILRNICINNPKSVVREEAIKLLKKELKN